MIQTQEQIEKLKTLQESLDWAIDLAENQLPELKTALQEIKDKVSNITIDLSPVAKEETTQDILSVVNRIITPPTATLEDDGYYTIDFGSANITIE